MSKLLKFEFRNTKRDFLQLILIMMGVTFLIQGLYTGLFSLSASKQAAETLSTYGPKGALAVGLGFFGLLAIIGSITIIITYLAYYVKLGSILQRDIYEDQAYFTFSIPHSGNQIIGAKVIVGFFWSIILPIILVTWNLILLFFNISIIMSVVNDGSIFDQMKVVSNFISDIPFGELFKHVDIGDVLTLSWSIFVNLILGLSVVYAAIILAYRMGRKKRKTAVWILIALAFWIIWDFIQGVAIGGGFTGTQFVVVTGNMQVESIGLNKSDILIKSFVNFLMAGLLFMYTSHTFEKKVEI